MTLYLLIGVAVMFCIELLNDWVLDFEINWGIRILIITLWPAALTFLIYEFIKTL